MNVFDLAAKLSLDKSEFEKGLTEATKSASKFGDGLKKGAKVAAAGVAAVGTAAAAAGTAIVKNAGEVAEYGDNIDKMSQKLGMSAEAYQKWDYVLGQSGTDIDSMTTGMKTLTNKLDDAKNGSEGAQEMFTKLGISMDELSKMSREEVFEATIKGLQGMEDSTERAALANDLFGKSGQNLTPLFNQSAESTAELMKAAEDLGFVMSDEAVKASAAYQDSLDTLQRTMGGLKNNLMGEFMPSITGVMDGLTQLFAGNSEEGIALITEGISGFTDKITEMLPKFLEVGSQIVLSLLTAIVDNLPELTTAAVGAISTLTTGLVDNLPEILKAGLEVMIALAKGIVENLPTLIPAMVDAVVEMVDTLTQPDNILMLINVAGELIAALAEGLIKSIPKLLKSVGIVIKNLGTALGEQLGETYLIVEKWFNEKLDAFKTWGKDLIDNFIKGIKEKFQNIKEAFKELGEIIKNLIGFSEPKEGPLSKFHTFAPDMIDLFIEGINGKKGELYDTVATAFDFSEAMTSPKYQRGNVAHGKYDRNAIGNANETAGQYEYEKAENVNEMLEYVKEADQFTKLIDQDQGEIIHLLTDVKAELKEVGMMLASGKAKAGVNLLNAREVGLMNA